MLYSKKSEQVGNLQVLARTVTHHDFVSAAVPLRAHYAPMNASIQVPRHGGARAGAGRKPSGYALTDFDQARARNEAAKASMNELKLEVERGRLVPREAVRQASAVALAVLAQSLRSMPDNLERTLSLKPEVVEAISVQVDAALTELARAFEAMAGGK